MATHDHSHGATTIIKGINKAFVVGIILNLGYVVAQVVVGLRIHSLSLLSDAGHNFLDVAGLALAMLAFKLAKSKSSDNYTYGYKKASILISLLNAVVLLISIGAIGWEAVFRFQNPEPMPGKTMAIMAAIGIVINGGSALLFFRDKEKDMNIKSAFLHLASDALVSLGLVVGGMIIYYTHLYWIDPLLSMIICLVIVASTWSLLRGSLKLSLDGVPENIDIKKITQELLKIDGVKAIRHAHFWAISTTENAMTAHLLVSSELSNTEISKLKHHLKHELEEWNVHHATLEIDFDHETEQHRERC
jgi:cobalt-zinc-cadmium efflux system protein